MQIVIHGKMPRKEIVSVGGRNYTDTKYEVGITRVINIESKEFRVQEVKGLVNYLEPGNVGFDINDF